jgi:Leucine-rich repeat (LRR) protein
VLAPALLSNTRLKELTLNGNRIWADSEAATALLSALASHPRLKRLSISYDESHTAAAEVAAAAYAVLVAASSVASIHLIGNRLGDVCLKPLFDALPANTSLQNLDLTGNRLSEAFMRDRVLPAVRASNTCLTDLHLDTEHAAAREAMNIVKQRRGW